MFWKALVLLPRGDLLGGPELNSLVSLFLKGLVSELLQILWVF